MVADDHPSIRENLRYLVNSEPDLEVVAVARNGLEALQKAIELKPDVAVLDQDMPVLDGLEVAARLRAEVVQIRVVIYTLENDIPPAHAWGPVVRKDAPPQELLAAIRGRRAATPTARRDVSP